MGTRSLTFFYESRQPDSQPLVAVYGQFDGYISGYGIDVSNFLQDMKVVNGFTSLETDGNHANGMGCLAAQFIAEIKDGIGNIYIASVDTDTDSVDYIYHIYDNHIVVESYGEIIFEGDWPSYVTFAVGELNSEKAD